MSKKLERINDSKFSKELEESKFSELSKIIGGEEPGTSKSKDCNISSADADTKNNDPDNPTKWSSDSTQSSDTVKKDDGCASE